MVLSGVFHAINLNRFFHRVLAEHVNVMVHNGVCSGRRFNVGSW